MLRHLRLAMLLLLVPGLATAMPPRKMADPVDRPPSGPGLPIGCRWSPGEILNAAFEMRAVRTAIDEFTSRGYVSLPTAHRAINGCATFGVNATGVSLAFQKPGFTGYLGDSTMYATPMIVVSSVEQSDGSVLTTVSAGIVIVDGVGQRFSTNEQLGVLPADPCFDVREGTAGGPRSVMPESTPPTVVYGEFLKKITDWAGCTAIGATGCTVTTYLHPGGRLLFTNPETASAVVGGCLIGSGLQCLWRGSR